METIEYQRLGIENAVINAEILKVMDSAAKVMKASNKDVDVYQVQDIMENIAEQQGVAHEIAEALSSSICSSSGNIDEKELIAELEELQEVC